MPREITARKDDALSSRVVRSSPLIYNNEAHADVEDRPEHVRAASSLVYLVDRFALVQDDANFLALVDPADHRVESHPLPPVPGGGRVHGSKRKLDLEACAVVPGTDGRLLLAFASGTSPTREWIVTVDWRAGGNGAPDAALHNAPGFFAALRKNTDFCGAGLNVEGAVFVDDDTLRLFQRGNAKPKDGRPAVDATGDIRWSELEAYLKASGNAAPPHIRNVVQYELGTLDGVRLTFSDAEPVDGQMLFSASAEDPEDGRIVGSVLGVIAPDGSARWSELIAEDGSPFNGKIEGLSLKHGDSDHVFFVIDSDSAEEPSRIYEADLDGPWHV